MKKTPLAALLLSIAAATCAHAAADTHWSPAWTAVPDSPGPALKAVTIRQVVHTGIGGASLRIRLSNLYGKAPLKIGPVHLALPAGAARIQPGTDRLLRFDGQATVTIPPGASVSSDPVAMPAAALADLAVSLYLPEGAPAPTLHGTGMQIAYLLEGDHGAAPDLPGAKRDDSRYFLTGLEVGRTEPASTLVVLGDSIADGVGSGNDANARWPDQLAARLQQRPASAAVAAVAIVNAGIAGNRLLHNAVDPFVGPSGLARFERDALAQPDLRWILVHEGINDLAASQLLTDPAQHASAAQVIEGLKTLAAQARAKGVQVWAGTLLPFEGTEGFYTEAIEAERQAVNAWIRDGGAFDGVVDFDRLMRDPAQPRRLQAALDSGDHLHPNAQGYRLMADAVDQRLFAPAPPARQ